jgi:hypothetical protein
MDKNTIQNRSDETGTHLKDMLNTWQVAQPSSGLDRRVLAAYRVATARQTLLGRIMTFRIPLPVALTCCALLVTATAIVMHNVGGSGSATVQVRTVTEIKNVEVPVVRETVVTRVVYRDRKPAEVAQKAPSTPTRGVNQRLAVANEVDGQGYLTNTELTGFQPNSDMSLKVIKRNAQNEK